MLLVSSISSKTHCEMWAGSESTEQKNVALPSSITAVSLGLLTTSGETAHTEENEILILLQ